MLHSSKAQSAILAGLVTASMLCPVTALAANLEPTVGEQTGTGQTEVYVQSIVGTDEHGGTAEPEKIPTTDTTPDPNKTYYDENGNPITNPDPSENPAENGWQEDNPLYNPDENPDDGLGDNIAFTVPSAINFVADAKGVLTGPNASVCYIENESSFAIHATSFDVDAQDGWTIIDNGSTASADNSADFQFGPEADTLDAYDYLTKNDVTTPTAWNMEPARTSGVADRVQMGTAGDIFNVAKDLTTKNKIATIKTYVKAGSAVATTPEP